MKSWLWIFSLGCLWITHTVFAVQTLAAMPPTTVSVLPNLPMAISLYPQEIALVKEKRRVRLEKGLHTIVLEDFPDSLIEGSLFLTPQDKGTRVVEYSMESHIKENSKKIRITCESTSQQEQEIEVSYLCRKVQWRVYYVATLSPSVETVDFSGWIEIYNNSGSHFQKARLQLIPTAVAVPQFLPWPEEAAKSPEPDKKNSTNSAKDFQRYHVSPQMDLKMQQPKHVCLSQARDIPVKPEYRLFLGEDLLLPQRSDPVTIPIETWISFENTKENGLGKPLPAGPIMVYQNGHEAMHALGTMPLSVIGVDDKVNLKVPVAHFHQGPITEGEQEAITVRAASSKLRQTEYKKQHERTTDVSYLLILKNPLDRPLEIRVILDLGDNEWEMLRESAPHKTVNKQGHWLLTLPARAEGTELKFRLRVIKPA